MQRREERKTDLLSFCYSLWQQGLLTESQWHTVTSAVEMLPQNGPGYCVLTLKLSQSSNIVYFKMKNTGENYK